MAQQQEEDSPDLLSDLEEEIINTPKPNETQNGNKSRYLTPTLSETSKLQNVTKFNLRSSVSILSSSFDPLYISINYVNVKSPSKIWENSFLKNGIS